MTERVLTKKEKRQQKERQIMDDTLAAQTQQRWDASAARKNNEKLILDVIDGEGRILRNDSWDTTRVPASRSGWYGDIPPEVKDKYKERHDCAKDNSPGLKDESKITSYVDLLRDISGRDTRGEDIDLDLPKPQLLHPALDLVKDDFRNHYDQLYGQIDGERKTPFVLAHQILKDLIISPAVQLQRNPNKMIDYSPCGQMLEGTLDKPPTIPLDDGYYGWNYIGGIQPDTLVYISGWSPQYDGWIGNVIGWSPPTPAAARDFVRELMKEIFARERSIGDADAIRKLAELWEKQIEPLANWEQSDMYPYGPNGCYKVKLNKSEKWEDNRYVFVPYNKLRVCQDGKCDNPCNRIQMRKVLNEFIREADFIPDDDLKVKFWRLSTELDGDSMEDKERTELIKELQKELQDDAGRLTIDRSDKIKENILPKLRNRRYLCPLYPSDAMSGGYMPGGLTLANISGSDDHNATLPLWVVSNTPLAGDPNTCYFAVTSKYIPNSDPDTGLDVRKVPGGDVQEAQGWMATASWALNYALSDNANSIREYALKTLSCFPVPKSDSDPRVKTTKYIKNNCPEGLLNMWLMENGMVIEHAQHIDGGFAIPVKLDWKKALDRGIDNITIERERIDNPDRVEELESAKIMLDTLKKLDKCRDEQGEASCTKKLKEAFRQHTNASILHGSLHALSKYVWSSFDPQVGDFSQAESFTEMKERWRAKMAKSAELPIEAVDGHLEFHVLAGEDPVNAPLDGVGWGKGCYAQIGSESSGFGMLGVFANVLFKGTRGSSKRIPTELVYHDEKMSVDTIYFVPWFCFRITETYRAEEKAKRDQSGGLKEYFAKKIFSDDDLALLGFGDKSDPYHTEARGGGLADTLEKAKAIPTTVGIEAENTINNAKSTAATIGAMALLTGLVVSGTILLKKKFGGKGKEKKRSSVRRPSVEKRSRARR